MFTFGKITLFQPTPEKQLVTTVSNAFKNNLQVAGNMETMIPNTSTHRQVIVLVGKSAVHDFEDVSLNLTIAKSLHYPANQKFIDQTTIYIEKPETFDTVHELYIKEKNKVELQETAEAYRDLLLPYARELVANATWNPESSIIVARMMQAAWNKPIV